MEHNFNPNKGDYKYILEEERRKENGEHSPLPSKNKIVDLYNAFRNWIAISLLREFKKHKRIKLAAPVLLEMFC